MLTRQGHLAHAVHDYKKLPPRVFLLFVLKNQHILSIEHTNHHKQAGAANRLDQVRVHSPTRDAAPLRSRTA